MTVNGDSSFHHVPVLSGRVREVFSAGPLRRLIDGTLGGGGHTEMLLRDHPELEVLGIDRDREALAAARARLAWAGTRFHAVHGNYSDMRKLASDIGWSEVNGVLLDIGVSSFQIDTPRRGFSWRADGPLDMRMDCESPVTASRILNSASEEELTEIFREYGEIRPARRLAAAVAEARRRSPLAATGEFAALVEKTVGRGRPGGPPVPTLAFQALRIAVNDELGELKRGLEAAEAILAPGGILCVISFHSLEDRIVKEFIRHAGAECVCPPGLPVCRCGKVPTMRAVTKKAVTAAADEIAANRRSAPARLRAAVKLSPNPPKGAQS